MNNRHQPSEWNSLEMPIAWVKMAPRRLHGSSWIWFSTARYKDDHFRSWNLSLL